MKYYLTIFHKILTWYILTLEFFVWDFVLKHEMKFSLYKLILPAQNHAEINTNIGKVY